MRAAATVIALLLIAAPAAAQDYFQPARGTALRADLLDAVRPLAEWDLGAPVEFVVHDMRVAGDVAFVSLWAQRPGGGAIDLRTAPVTRRGELDASVGDGPGIDALLKRSGRMWVVVRLGLNATECWWCDPAFCPTWGAVLPETCGGN